MTETNEAKPKAAHWRIILAAVLDFFTAFLVFGFAIAAMTGDLSEGGFQLNGWPALVCFALIVVYFWIGRRHLGGTLWQRILKAY